MQYHLNGFRPGSPHLAPGQTSPRPEAPPEEVDVLIVGCGPAGLTLAAQLAAFPDIATCIVDQKPGPLEFGQADGIACRSMEMFEAFGFAEQVLREAYWVNETAFWKQDPDRPGHIVRSDRIQDTEDGLSEFPHVILSQARVHDFYLDVMRNAPTRLAPYYATAVTGMSVTREADFPVQVTLQNTESGAERVIRARYVVGCDGARSVVRDRIGLKLRGDAANQAWGVMDVLADTDFPDIRLKSVIRSASEGSVLIIPREGGYLVRIYVEMDKLAEGERVAARNITQDHIIRAAKRVLAPYRFDVKEVAWWSVYEIGQRLCDRFDDGAEDGPRVFIAGDAGHTHSPKAGQGMNVSMADAFNLGWKLAAVLQGLADPQLLSTYSQERQAVAQELIDFDRTFAAMFSAKPGDAAAATTDPKTFQRYFQKHGRFTAGTSICYAPSLITQTGAAPHLAPGFPVGMRFHSAPVIRVVDARPMQLAHAFKADGRWRLLAFAGRDAGGIAELCAHLEGAGSPILRYTPKGADPDAVIDFRVVYQAGHRSLDAQTMPAVLRPAKGRYGLRDMEKAFAPDPQADIFDLRRIDRDQGCLVIIRPDQYVADVLPLTDHQAVSDFLGRFMRPQR